MDNPGKFIRISCKKDWESKTEIPDLFDLIRGKRLIWTMYRCKDLDGWEKKE